MQKRSINALSVIKYFFDRLCVVSKNSPDSDNSVMHGVNMRFIRETKEK